MSAPRHSMRFPAVGAALLLTLGSALAAPGEAQLKEGKALFLGNSVSACAVCHTLKDAGATGTIGPSLDEIAPDHDRVMKAMAAGLGAMPVFTGKLTPEQLDAVASYVAWATHPH